jgi:hypothetical protein
VDEIKRKNEFVGELKENSGAITKREKAPSKRQPKIVIGCKLNWTFEISTYHFVKNGGSVFHVED